MIIVSLELLIMIIMTSLSQIIIKIGSDKIITNSGKATLLKSFFNCYIIFGLVLVLIAPLLYFSALSRVPLNFAYSVTGLGYLIVIILGRLILKEGISFFHIAGGVLILVGFIVWNAGAGLY